MKYCAFLRGVNVNGTNMKMADVILVFENAGMKCVYTVLATGNVIFESDFNKFELRQMLEKEMSDYFLYPISLFVKSADDIFEILKSNPFQMDNNLHCYVFVTEKGAENEINAHFNSTKRIENEKAEIVNDIFFWQIPKGNTLDSEFSKILGKKSLKDKFTSRNINTMKKISLKIQL